MKNDTISKPIFLQRLRRHAATIGAVEREAEHVARMHRDADLVPVLDHAPILVDDAGARLLDLQLVMAIVGVLILGREVEIVGIERFDPDECLVASRGRRQFGEALAAAMLRGLGLSFGEVRVARRVDVDLHHEGELRKFLRLHFDQAGEDLFPSRRAEEIVIDQEQRFDTMVAARVAHPFDHRVGLARAHRAAHHVLHAAVGAGERASARGVERRHAWD